MKTCDKVVVLLFDEMKVASQYEYDELKGQACLRNGNNQYLWNMTSVLLLEIITELSKIGFDVCACVSDCGGSNAGLGSELNLDTKNAYFKHPVIGEKIYVCAKPIRNCFFYTGFILRDGSLVTTEPVDSPLSVNNAEISPCHKLGLLTEIFSYKRCRYKTTLQIFQKGVIMSSTSLQTLFEDMKRRHGMSFILTHRLDQGCLGIIFLPNQNKRMIK
ncbi:hypothetical protein PR048_016026 [Dryococelus australis]|uniref:Uncharacterized protein n=1 Tax=Dryococelus australis TaxID=614101 RepID=A0ABQ9HIY1_9NEOP|nr:hypothetical protein PR048_016026 [Dryococelus australis]